MRHLFFWFYLFVAAAVFGKLLFAGMALLPALVASLVWWTTLVRVIVEGIY